MAKKITRTFPYDGSKAFPVKANFEVETTLTNAEALAILEKDDSELGKACMMEVRKLDAGTFIVKPNLIAWAFKKASEGIRTNHGVVVLGEHVTSCVSCGNPLPGEVDGHPFLIQQHGARSKYDGQYKISDGVDWPAGAFYGRAVPNDDGVPEWKPTAATPAAIVEALKAK